MWLPVGHVGLIFLFRRRHDSNADEPATKRLEPFWFGRVRRCLHVRPRVSHVLKCTVLCIDVV